MADRKELGCACGLLHYDAQSFVLRIPVFLTEVGDHVRGKQKWYAQNGVSRDGILKAPQMKFPLLLGGIWNGDSMSRGQGLVRAALGGRPGMKWITHIVALSETKKDWLKHLWESMLAQQIHKKAKRIWSKRVFGGYSFLSFFFWASGQQMIPQQFKYDGWGSRR